VKLEIMKIAFISEGWKATFSFHKGHFLKSSKHSLGHKQNYNKNLCYIFS